MRRITGCAAALALCAAPAVADGLYAGAGVGMFDLEVGDSTNLGQLDFQGDDTSYKLFAGWRFNKFLALELAYVDFGTPSDSVAATAVDIGLSGFAPYAVATLPIPLLPVELFAKVGYYFYDIEATLRDPVNGNFRLKDSDQDLVYAVGAGLTFLDKVTLRLEYEEIDLSDTRKSNAVWLTGALRF